MVFRKFSLLATKQESQANMLPKVMKHSLPLKLFHETSNSSSSSYSGSIWVLESDPNRSHFVNADALNPLKAYTSLPHITFGPKSSACFSSELFDSFVIFGLVG